MSSRGWKRFALFMTSSNTTASGDCQSPLAVVLPFVTADSDAVIAVAIR